MFYGKSCEAIAYGSREISKFYIGDLSYLMEKSCSSCDYQKSCTDICCVEVLDLFVGRKNSTLEYSCADMISASTVFSMLET